MIYINNVYIMMRKGDNMMNKRDDFIAKAKELFNGKNDFTRAELVTVANEMGMKYAPSWIVKNDEYKMGNGLYSLIGGSVMPETKVDAVMQNIQVPEQPQAKKTIAGRITRRGHP